MPNSAAIRLRASIRPWWRAQVVSCSRPGRTGETQIGQPSGWAAGVLRIGAWDADPAPPEPPVPLEQVVDLEEGRGLGLVRACADLWGWQPLAREGNRAKVVWCELAAA
nr:hypothetical protein [Streptomyces sp. MK7]